MSQSVHWGRLPTTFPSSADLQSAVAGLHWLVVCAGIFPVYMWIQESAGWLDGCHVPSKHHSFNFFIVCFLSLRICCIHWMLLNHLVIYCMKWSTCTFMHLASDIVQSELSRIYDLQATCISFKVYTFDQFVHCCHPLMFVLQECRYF